MLLAEHDAVLRVSEEVLWAFHFLAPEFGIRNLKQFVQSFVDPPQHNHVVYRNLPLDWLDRLESQKLFTMAGWRGKLYSESSLAWIET